MLCEYVWLCHTQKRSPNVDHRSIALHAGNQGASDPRSQHAHVRAHTHRHAHTQTHTHAHLHVRALAREEITGGELARGLEGMFVHKWAEMCACMGRAR